MAECDPLFWGAEEATFFLTCLLISALSILATLKQKARNQTVNIS